MTSKIVQCYKDIDEDPMRWNYVRTITNVRGTQTHAYEATCPPFRAECLISYVDIHDGSQAFVVGSYELWRNEGKDCEECIENEVAAHPDAYLEGLHGDSEEEVLRNFFDYLESEYMSPMELLSLSAAQP